ncbi:BTAD domain-containing putative transcriptional regulator [Solwaraspora sp. WMMD1047]|uniref:AfsR/SARP family transcriptional regulator n=1 Tax=Solwaraspora sp. WMMD1047 TaxID=3016102 RepID=UPI002415B13D|nr:BTAD domain-containing putative transcriptional regulator [Solwaraspora sp. WMMD1047]MDG4834369.1 BTAD domain-containing putative transcriptional regulator [Solwaraspora sp. WMMD1047]
MEVRFRILGPLQVFDDTGPLALGGRRRRTALAVLLAHPGQVVALDHLIDAVWDDHPPTTAKRQIQNDVSALRRLIGPAIVADGPGYRAVVRPGDLDAQVFEDRVAESTRLAEAGQPAEAAALLRSALELWRGPALAGLCGRAVQGVAARLDERRLLALEYWFDLELSLGRPAELVGELAELVAAHPLRERLVGLLMLALHRSGRQGEAVQAYHGLRSRLADELGLDPGPQLRQLHATLLKNEADDGPAAGAWWGRAIGPQVPPAGPVPPAPTPPPSPRPAPPTPAQLPGDIAGFTGRAEQLRLLDDLSEGTTGSRSTTVPILVISGMAGVGKTALAVHWGHLARDRFPDGQLYLDLRGYADDEPVGPPAALAHLLRSLGERDEQIPADVQTAAGRYRSLLAGRQLLVVLDNASSAEQVRPLLPASPGCLALVTSRARLTGLLARDGAQGVALDVLTAEEAYALLVRILGADRAAADPAAVVDVAAACSRLPLALRVAAANILHGGWPGVVDYLAALRGGDRMAALEIQGDEQAGVRAAFDLSYRSLDAATRRTFRLVGLIPGPDLTTEAVAALAGLADGPARNQLGRLTAAHLVEWTGADRYACHDLLRGYAAERAAAEDPAPRRRAALERLHDWYAARADAAARMLYPHVLRLPTPPATGAADGSGAGATSGPTTSGPTASGPTTSGPTASGPTASGPTTSAAGSSTAGAVGGFATSAAALAWLDAERANLVAAIRHAAEHGPEATAWMLADTLRGYFWLRVPAADWEQAARAALTAADRAGDQRAQAAALLSIGDLNFRRNAHEPAIDNYLTALPLAERTGWTQCAAAILGNLGVAHREAGRLRDAARYLRRAHRLCRATGARYAQAIALDALGLTYWQAGRLADAADCCGAAADINRQIGSRLGEAAALADLGVILHSRGLAEAALDRFTTALALFRDVGDRTNEACVLRGLAMVHGDAGRYGEAAQLAHAALELARDLADRRVEADALNTLGALRRGQDHPHEALAHHRRALALARAVGNRYVEAEALMGCARTLAALGAPEAAAEAAHGAATIGRRYGFRRLVTQALAIVPRPAPAREVPVTPPW